MSMEDAIENIDIGGPSMVRSAAKNWRDVTIVCDPADYGKVLSELRENGWTSDDTRLKLSAKAYTHTAEYDMCIASWMREKAGLNEKLFLEYDLVQNLRYGENPHQSAKARTLTRARSSTEPSSLAPTPCLSPVRSRAKSSPTTTYRTPTRRFRCSETSASPSAWPSST